MNKVRTIGLDLQDIENTIKDLKNIKTDIDKKIESSIEDVLDQAVEYCKSKCPPTFTDYNLYWEKTEKGYRIVQEGAGVVFVEFGTGVVGENATQHPLHDEFGLDPINSRKEYKFIADDGREAWYYPKKDGGWGITSGQPASMQMFQTAEWLREVLPAEMSMVIGKAIYKW